MWFLICLTLFGLVISLSRAYYDLTIPSSGGKLWGIDVESRGSLNPLAPFQIICSVLFLYLCAKHSKYAWHVITVFVVFSLPSYWLLRNIGIYFRSPIYNFEDVFYIAVWIIALVYIMTLRSKYVAYIRKVRNHVLSCEGPITRLKTSHPEEIKNLGPEIQVRIGEIPAWLIVAFMGYLFIFRGPPDNLKVALMLSFFSFVVPAIYIYALRSKKLLIAKIAYFAWMIPVVLLFVASGLRELILLGNFSRFMLWWFPLALVAMLLRVGVRGLTRIVKPEMEATDTDTVGHILMLIGIFLCFFCGVKITHWIMPLYWEHFYSNQIARFSLCLLGGFIVSYPGAIAGAFLGSLTDFFIHGTTGKELAG